MVTIDIVYEGQLHCACVHAPSGTGLGTDAPTDHRGRGESYSPTDLVATAVGTCMATVMGIRADDRGWDVAGTRVRVEKHMTREQPRRVARLVVDLDVAGSHDAEARQVLEQAARGCPVVLSIHPDIELDVRFRWEGD